MSRNIGWATRCAVTSERMRGCTHRHAAALDAGRLLGCDIEPHRPRAACSAERAESLDQHHDRHRLDRVEVDGVAVPDHIHALVSASGMAIDVIAV